MQAAIDLRGKTAIVTGAAHGIGRAICRRLVLHGARVAAMDMLGPELAKTKAVLEEEVPGAWIHTVQMDVTKEAEVAAAVAEVLEFGSIDIVINNAGGVCGQVHQPLEEVDAAQWQQIFAVNLTGVFYVTKAVAPHMKERGYGRIVNISSGAGRSVSLTGIQAYASAKAGQIGFTRQMARELGSFGITVNNVAPGFVLSNPSTIRQWEAMGEEAQQKLLADISLRRLGEGDDIASAVLFFASDLSRYVTGQILSADGGIQLF